ncbi:MAG: primase-helicase family protein [Bacteroidota bacterium]
MKEAMTYCDARLQELGITNEHNEFEILEENGTRSRIDFFAAQENTDDIIINYVSLDGMRETWWKDKKKEIPYKVRRLKNPDNPKHKYLGPKGAPTRPFFPPPIIRKFQAKEKIHILIITEGQFKAFKGCMAGLDVIGISGIQNLKNKEVSKHKIHDEISRLIEGCQIRNVVFLQDADLFEMRVDFDKEFAEEENTTDRLKSFYNSVARFKELMKTHIEVDTYFSHIRERFNPEAKGLDDLFVKFPDQEEEIAADLRKLLSDEQTYFETISLTQSTHYKLKRIFYLSDVTLFYEKYQDQIGNKVFKWRHSKYQATERSNGSIEVKMVRHKDSYLFVRVGCDYYKKILKIDASGKEQMALVPWRKSEITQDYRRECKNFLDMIDRFDAFCNVPAHDISNYQEVFENRGSRNMNLYFPLTHTPAEGEWPNTKRFIQHIFGEQYEMGLDYIQILYQYPLEKQYILCLVNRLRGTGKSSFLFFLRELFGENVTIASSNDFNDNFNSSIASKLVVAIDEGFIEKRAVLEKLKSMSTNTKINMNKKNVDKVELDFFAKFVLTSNDERNFISLDGEETRFWVVKVPQFEKEDPFMMEKVKAEIPAFLHFLQNREIVHPKTSRMWFAPKLVETAALKVLKDSSKSWVEKAILDLVTNLMLDFGEAEIKLTPKDIFDMLEGGKHRHQTWMIKDALKLKMNLSPAPKATRYKIYRMESTMGVQEKKVISVVGRPYTFLAESYLSAEELAALPETKAYLALAPAERAKADEIPASGKSDDIPF